MGASPSIFSLFDDASGWLLAYIDEESFVDDFNAIDTDCDGQINLDNIIEFICKKAMSNHQWNVFLTNPKVIDLAYQAACPGSGQKQGIVRIEQFRHLFLHLYANSILWAHFNNGLCVMNGKKSEGRLDFHAFKLACSTLAHSHGVVAPTEEQLVHDFHMIDVRKMNSVSFTEVCNYCYQTNSSQQKSSQHTTLLNEDLCSPSTEVLVKLIETKRFGRHEPRPSIVGFLGNFFHKVVGTESKANKSEFEIRHEKHSEQSLDSAVSTLGEMTRFNKKLSRSLSMNSRSNFMSDTLDLHNSSNCQQQVDEKQHNTEHILLPSLSQIMELHEDLVIRDQQFHY